MLPLNAHEARACALFFQQGRGAGALPARLVVRLHVTIGGSCTPLPAAGGCAATFAAVGSPPPHGCLRCKNVKIISQLRRIVLVFVLLLKVVA